jgi:hypothetical protein
VAHPQAKELEIAVQKVLANARVVFEVGTHDLMAEIETPNGMRRL